MILTKNSQVILYFKKDFGIGFYKSRILLAKCGLNLNYNLKYRFFLKNRFYLRRINYLIFSQNWIVNERLQYRKLQYINFLKLLKNYKYLRLKYGLPLNGQRSHTNRQTIKRFSALNGFIKLTKKVNQLKFKKFKSKIFVKEQKFEKFEKFKKFKKFKSKIILN
jgi:ribosomal protein S13